MFRIVSIIGFVITLVGIVCHYIAFSVGKGCRWHPIDILRKLVYLLTLLFLEQKLSAIGILRKLFYLLALLCFVVLTVTGFYPTLILGRHLSGYLLMVHATFAPVFAGCVAVLAVMWAHNCRFDKNILQQKAVNKTAGSATGSEKCELAQKISFWLIVSLAVPLILSIVGGMFPLFGTDIQKLLLNLHRYSALLLAMAAIVHTYLIILTQTRK
jgi:cytochrome b subunit of formate dehydrogenase